MNIPASAYRVQLNSEFTLSHLSELTDYLQELGVRSIYASPLLVASGGSNHGYDVNDPTRINPEIGTLEQFREVRQQFKERGIGWIQDIVPNHMNFDVHNPWMKDVMERGINSSYAHHFDIDWQHPYMPGKLMIPFLGKDLNDAIDEGEIKVVLEDDGLYLGYFDKRYPLNPDTYALVLSGSGNTEQSHLNAIIGSLIAHIGTDIAHWNQLKEQLARELSGVAAAAEDNSPNIQLAIDAINNDLPTLHRLVYAQHYILCCFEEANKRINYRRFFNVNSLICLRMEDAKVFEDYHRFTYQLHQEGLIDGLRLDHIDGLEDPEAYTARLRERFGADCFIIMEKILDVKEEIPAMNIEGTSGYEFLSYVNQVLTDNEGSDKLLEYYKSQFTGFTDYEDLVFEKKWMFLGKYLNGEWDNLLRTLISLNLVTDEEVRLPKLKEAIGRFMAAFPVYRAYVQSLPLEPHDQRFVDEAFAKANVKSPELNHELALLQEVFTPHADKMIQAHRVRFIRRLMQFTGPLAAKGVEDTTFYLYNPLISHNEVGDQPCVLGIEVDEFHRKMVKRQQQNPNSFNCTSTHDTKRGEDGRLRINLLSEMPEEWIALVKDCQEVNAPHRRKCGDVMAPMINDEYLLYQSIVGAFPEDLRLTDEFRERTKAFFTKALREGKLMSDYVSPNDEYEAACSGFIDDILRDDSPFVRSIVPFIQQMIGFANTYSMVQVIMKATTPGIPDFYRGCELFDLSYVDPDNRRPVNYTLRRELMQTLHAKKKESHEAMTRYARDRYPEGAEKMLVTMETLQVRNEYADLFRLGEYIPLYADGQQPAGQVSGQPGQHQERQVIAYFRRHGSQWILVVLPMGIVQHTGKKCCLTLPEGAPQQWKHAFTGEEVTGSTIDVHELFRNFPVALLTGH